MSQLTERLQAAAQVMSTRGMGGHTATVYEAARELERLYRIEASTQKSEEKPEVDPPGNEEEESA